MPLSLCDFSAEKSSGSSFIYTRDFQAFNSRMLPPTENFLEPLCIKSVKAVFYFYYILIHLFI